MRQDAKVNSTFHIDVTKHTVTTLSIITTGR